MAIENNVQAATYNGSLLTVSLLSGNAVNLVLSSFGPISATTVTENNNALEVGETVLLGGSQAVEVLGSGTAQSGISILGITIGIGPAVPIVLVRDVVTGQRIFLYPDGLPTLSGATLLTVRLSPVDYVFPGGVICLARGTLIPTADGLRPIEEIRAGQRILTRDHGLREVLWKGCRRLDPAFLRANPRLLPIRIAAGALGDGLPERPVVVSPQHRVLLRSGIAERMFGEREVLAPAKHLLGAPGIEQLLPEGGVEYHHLMLESHELLMTAGLCSETLYPGREALRAIGPEGRSEVLALFPELIGVLRKEGQPPPFRPARRFLTGRETRSLLRRHLKNARRLCA